MRYLEYRKGWLRLGRYWYSPKGWRPGLAWAVPDIRGGMNDPQLDQAHFSLVSDDGGTNAGTLGTEDGDWSQDVDTNFRIRFSMDETAGEKANGGSWQLQYNLASAGWNNVDASSSVARSSAGAGTDDGATTQRLSSSTGSFGAGAYDETDGSVNFNLSNGEFTEVEYCLQIRSADVTDGQTIQFRVVWSGTQQTATYGQTPTVTVVEATLPDLSWAPGGVPAQVPGAHIREVVPY